MHLLEHAYLLVSSLIGKICFKIHLRIFSDIFEKLF